MRTIYLLLSALLLSDFLHSQTPLSQWTWLSGEDHNIGDAVYGQQGVADSKNQPSLRYNTHSWKDNAGNFWLYGGTTNQTARLNSGSLADLWMFDVVSKQWTWVNGEVDVIDRPAKYGNKGVASAGNTPGSRSGSVNWSDKQGNLWLFGGGTPSGSKNDLWKYSISNKQWTWISGDTTKDQSGRYRLKGIEDPLNSPGSRGSSSSWTDADGNLWMFGGNAFENRSYEPFNDLWRFSPSSGQWTWMSGDSVKNQAPVYGTKLVPSSANKPGARTNSTSWTDASGNLWLFGGQGNEYGAVGLLNQLWKYTISSGLWTFINGDQGIYNAFPFYGTKGIESPANKPGPRTGSTGWMDKSGNLWMFGGAAGLWEFNTVYNDLWKFNVATSQWTWVGGDNSGDYKSPIVTKGTENAANWPAGRISPVAWEQDNGDFWMFGGNVKQAGDGYSVKRGQNDLWRLRPGTLSWIWVSGDNPASGRNLFKGASIKLGVPHWTEPDGSIWLFGNNNSAMYRKDANSSEWVWKGGSETESLPSSVYYTGVATPGGRANSFTWRDAAGDLWLYGGGNAGYYGDLWKYQVATATWTFMSGSQYSGFGGSFGSKKVMAPGNYPGSRTGSISWIDSSGNFWLFGGYRFIRNCTACSIGFSNDLWKYSPALNQWAWMAGSDRAEGAAVYGTKGIAAPDNTPGTFDENAITWTDKEGNLWLMRLYGSSEIWKFQTSTGQWAWMSGATEPTANSKYGQKGLSSADNSPGTRFNAARWADKDANIWLFGGLSTAPNMLGRYLNDVWKFSSVTGEWTWMGGDNSSMQPSYGTLGIQAPTNRPGGRQGSVLSGNSAGSLWMIGGYGNLPSGPAELFDQWKLSFSTEAALPVVISSFQARQSGANVDLSWTTASEQNSKAFHIERSADGISFSSIGVVQAAENSSVSRKYIFTDQNPFAGTNYYRLRQVDLDNKEKYSGLIKILMPELTGMFSIFENPASTTLRLKFNLTKQTDVFLEVSDLRGVIVLKKQLHIQQGSDLVNVAISSLGSGMYIARAFSAEVSGVVTFVKK